MTIFASFLEPPLLFFLKKKRGVPPLFLSLDASSRRTHSAVSCNGGGGSLPLSVLQTTMSSAGYMAPQQRGRSLLSSAFQTTMSSAGYMAPQQRGHIACSRRSRVVLLLFCQPGKGCGVVALWEIVTSLLCTPDVFRAVIVGFLKTERLLFVSFQMFGCVVIFVRASPALSFFWSC